jgi:hypothetical protein
MNSLVTMLLVALCSVTFAQDSTVISNLKGVGARLTTKTAYTTSLMYRPWAHLELQAIAGYSYHTPQVANFDKVIVSGAYIGCGLAFIPRPLFDSYNPHKKVKGSARLGVQFIRGAMRLEVEKTFNGSAFDHKTITETYKNVKTMYSELSLGYEINIKDRIKIDLIPIILGDSYVQRTDYFIANFSHIGGKTGWPLAAGLGITYLWK